MKGEGYRKSSSYYDPVSNSEMICRKRCGRIAASDETGGTCKEAVYITTIYQLLRCCVELDVAGWLQIMKRKGHGRRRRSWALV
jgi:hypothetical protein